MRAGKKSKRVVIDTSVLYTASAIHGETDICVAFLDTFMAMRHRLVLTPKLEDEISNRESRFGRRWLAEMYSRDLVEDCSGSAYGALGDQISRLRTGANAKEQMKKDSHLIQAAIETDRRIASLDEAARGPFREASRSLQKLRDIVWVNPTRDDENAIEWLEQGAPAEEFRTLGYEPFPARPRTKPRR